MVSYCLWAGMMPLVVIKYEPLAWCLSGDDSLFNSIMKEQMVILIDAVII